MKRIITVILTALCLTSAFAEGDAPVLMSATLSLSQVPYALLPITTAKPPHPFYQAQCKNSKPQDYAAAAGQAIIWFNPKTLVMKYAITYRGLSGAPIMAHFHIGKTGVEGPIVQTICGMPPKNSKALGFSAAAIDGSVCPNAVNGFLSGTYQLKGNPADHLTAEQEKAALLNGLLYINIHTCLNELGELRGQILPLK